MGKQTFTETMDGAVVQKNEKKNSYRVFNYSAHYSCSNICGVERGRDGLMDGVQQNCQLTYTEPKLDGKLVTGDKILDTKTEQCLCTQNNTENMD